MCTGEPRCPDVGRPAGSTHLDGTGSPTASDGARPNAHSRSRGITDADRNFLRSTLRDLEAAVLEPGARDQLLHGEPHVGNVLSTELGPRFIDLETCCLGSVEFDLAHGPRTVDEHYPGVDRGLVEDCRGLILAMVAKHRCAPGDEFPNSERALLDLLDALRDGPPWPSLDTVLPQLRDP
jgi:aminoglycoside phosphotransferase (APT) family kinase protein